MSLRLPFTCEVCSKTYYETLPILTVGPQLYCEGCREDRNLNIKKISFRPKPKAERIEQIKEHIAQIKEERAEELEHELKPYYEILAELEGK